MECVERVTDRLWECARTVVEIFTADDQENMGDHSLPALPAEGTGGEKICMAVVL